MGAPIPDDEAARLIALHSLGIIDGEPVDVVERVVDLTARIFGTPMAAFTLVDTDRQVFKASVGIDLTETPRDVAVCNYGILQDDPLVVHDTKLDARFDANPLLADLDLRFYAGAPVTNMAGDKLGMLCILDHEPREFTEYQSSILVDLAALIQREVAVQQILVTDAQSGLCNLQGFLNAGDDIVQRARAGSLDVACVTVEVVAALEGFKSPPEPHEFVLTNAFTMEISDALTNSFGDADLIARVAPSRFAILMAGAAHDRIDECLGSLLDTAEQWPGLRAKQRQAELRAGVSYLAEQQTLVDLLMASADSTLPVILHDL